jgi:hypothetical protein
MADRRTADISIHHIPIDGGWGAAAIIAVLVTVMLIELEPLRPLLLTMGLGAVFGVGRILRRRGTGGSSF